MAGKLKKFGPRLTVSLTSSDYDALSALAEKDDVSVSWVIRRAIDEYLSNHRHEAESMLPLRILQKAEKSADKTKRTNDESRGEVSEAGKRGEMQ